MRRSILALFAVSSTAIMTILSLAAGKLAEDSTIVEIAKYDRYSTGAMVMFGVTLLFIGFAASTDD